MGIVSFDPLGWDIRQYLGIGERRPRAPRGACGLLNG
jgi:hypothetical protein